MVLLSSFPAKDRPSPGASLAQLLDPGTDFKEHFLLQMLEIEQGKGNVLSRRFLYEIDIEKEREEYTNKICGRCNFFRNLGLYREISILRIRYYASALLYTYSAFIIGTLSNILRSVSLEAVPETGTGMQSIHSGTALKGKVVREARQSG